MALSGSRLNGARYASILSDIQAQFPMPVGLLTAEQTAFTAGQQKIAHAIADHEGTDVVTEITTNAQVAATGPDAQGGTVVSTGTVS